MAELPPPYPSAAAPRQTRMPREARRRQLMNAAREVFVARGYHGTVMDEIAERAGVSKPVLYQHFPGKEELYLALVDESTQDLVIRVRGALSSTTDNRQRVSAAFAAFYDYVADESASFRLVFESDALNNPEVRHRLEQVMADTTEMISKFICEGTGIADAHARYLSTALIGMAQVSARHWLDSGRTIPRQDAVQLLARLAWDGISGWPITG